MHSIVTNFTPHNIMHVYKIATDHDIGYAEVQIDNVTLKYNTDSLHYYITKKWHMHCLLYRVAQIKMSQQ